MSSRCIWPTYLAQYAGFFNLQSVHISQSRSFCIRYSSTVLKHLKQVRSLRPCLLCYWDDVHVVDNSNCRRSRRKAEVIGRTCSWMDLPKNSIQWWPPLLVTFLILDIHVDIIWQSGKLHKWMLDIEKCGKRRHGELMSRTGFMSQKLIVFLSHCFHDFSIHIHTYIYIYMEREIEAIDIYMLDGWETISTLDLFQISGWEKNKLNTRWVNASSSLSPCFSLNQPSGNLIRSVSKCVDLLISLEFGV